MVELLEVRGSLVKVVLGIVGIVGLLLAIVCVVLLELVNCCVRSVMLIVTGKQIGRAHV